MIKGCFNLTQDLKNEKTCCLLNLYKCLSKGVSDKLKDKTCEHIIHRLYIKDGSGFQVLKVTLIK